MKKMLIFTLLMSVAGVAQPESIRFKSPLAQVPVLELFTSHGCSSCPSADEWLRSFIDQPGLWRQVIPMSFHVDYWDGLGWPDRFAHSDYSQRQRDYRLAGSVRSVYTPGFVLKGREWRRWFRIEKPDLTPGPAVGKLEVEVVPGQRAELSFTSGLGRKHTRLTAHLAVLGFGVSSDIGGGENAGRTLEEEFVVLGVTSSKSKAATAEFGWSLPWPDVRQVDTKRQAVVVWISRAGNPGPVQATGGWISSTGL